MEKDPWFGNASEELSTTGDEEHPPCPACIRATLLHHLKMNITNQVIQKLLLKQIFLERCRAGGYYGPNSISDREDFCKRLSIRTKSDLKKPLTKVRLRIKPDQLHERLISLRSNYGEDTTKSKRGAAKCNQDYPPVFVEDNEERELFLSRPKRFLPPDKTRTKILAGPEKTNAGNSTWGEPHPDNLSGAVVSPGVSTYSSVQKPCITVAEGVLVKDGVMTIDGTLLRDAKIDPNGFVYDSKGEVVGYVDKNCRVVALKETMPSMTSWSEIKKPALEPAFKPKDSKHLNKLKTPVAPNKQTTTWGKQSSPPSVKDKKEKSSISRNSNAKIKIPTKGKSPEVSIDKNIKKNNSKPPPKPITEARPVEGEIDPLMWRTNPGYDFMARLGRGLTLDEILLALMSMTPVHPDLAKFLRIDKNKQKENWNHYGAHDNEITAQGLFDAIHRMLEGPSVEETVLSLGSTLYGNCLMGQHVKRPIDKGNMRNSGPSKIPAYRVSATVPGPFEKERVYERVAAQMQKTPEVRKYLDRYYLTAVKKRFPNTAKSKPTGTFSNIIKNPSKETFHAASKKFVPKQPYYTVTSNRLINRRKSKPGLKSKQNVIFPLQEETESNSNPIVFKPSDPKIQLPSFTRRYNPQGTPPQIYEEFQDNRELIPPYEDADNWIADTYEKHILHHMQELRNHNSF